MMGRCTDPRFEEMLHAFELGLLEGDDYEKFRLHLFDCQYCFERARKLEAAAELMRHDPEIRAIPEKALKEQAESGDAVGDRESPAGRRRLWPKLLPTSLAAAAIVVLLVLQPWQIEIRPTQEAVAAENRLAIICFDNLAVPEDTHRLGEITTSLLIADLSESHFLQVVSSQRLRDILKLMGEEDSRIADHEVATEIAERAGARWMLTGSILQVQPRLIMTAEIVEVASGSTVASQRVTGDEGEDVFALVDRLTVQVKNDLALPLAALEETDRRVAEVTTHSPEAYRYYLEGVTHYYRYYNTEAVASFHRALAEDSTFAMAYYYLSLLEDEALIARAVEYADGARRQEGHIIRSREAHLAGDIDRAIRELQESLEFYPDAKDVCYQLGLCYAARLEFEPAIEYYTRAVEIDPLYKIVYNQMAYTYDWMGRFEESIRAIDMYVSLAPDEPNPLDSRGDIYSRNGHLQSGIDSYAAALEVKPDFWASLFKFGRNHLFLGNHEVADSCFSELVTCSHPIWRANGRAARAYVPLCEGRFDDAIALIDQAIETTRAEDNGAEHALFPLLKAIAYEDKGDLPRALAEIDESIRLRDDQFVNDRVYNRHLQAQLLAQTGKVALAEQVVEDLIGNSRSANDTLRYWYAVASVEYANGNLDDALRAFEEAAADTVYPYTPANGRLAALYLEVGRPADAIDELRDLLERDFTQTRLYYGSWTARAHYLMGMAHEQLGRAESAIEEYRLFLDLWKNADTGVVEVEDARARLTRLTAKS